ncbi:MAG: putative solute-binding protein [bacterium]|nr:hypothetical protein [Myxococcales bacterium]
MNLRPAAAALAVASLLALTGPALAAGEAERTLCVFDPSGANGQVYQLMKNYQTEALGWGVKFDMKPYTDEKTAADDFKAGKCHAALITGTRLRPFHAFAGTLEAMGAMPSYDIIHHVIKSLASTKAAPINKSGDYEIAGVFPGGAIYLFIDDRSIDSVEELAGKKIATLAYDEASKTMVGRVGASMQAADVGTFAGMFNNGGVDAAYAPAFAYKALELYKGIGDKGAVVRYPLAQMTLQVLIRSKDFPEDFGAKSRAFAAANFDRALKLAEDAEAQIPAKHWLDLPEADKARYDLMFRDVRVELRDKKSVYDKKALSLLKKARCHKDARRPECVEAVE